MNNNLLGEQIARFRKAMGMTQEDLGKAVGISAQAVSRWECGGAPDVTLLPAVADTLEVTVDALFGREAGEKIHIEDVVRRWMLTVPQGQRVDRLCRLVWTAAGPVMSGKPEDHLDISGYENCCETVNSETGERWLRRTRIMMEDGVILGVRAEDMSFAAIFPEPETGWEQFLIDNARCRRLFEVLARPCCLELLEYLHSKPPFAMRRYTPGAIAKPMGLDAAETEALMDALAELDILSKVELETEDGIINAYLLSEDEALVPFLYFVRWLTTGGSGFLNATYRKTPMLRGKSGRNQRKRRIDMKYYFKKNWKKLALPCALILVCEGAYVIMQLIMMRSFDVAINLDFRGFLYWTAAEIAGYAAYFALAALESILEARTKRALNNQVRHDLYLSLLSKDHQAFHSQGTGEYLSWLSANVKQIERLAWEPFFSCFSQIVLIMWCVLALISLHWIMLAAGLVSAAVMLAIPKLFQKQMEQLGEACVKAEADGVSKMKDLLSGFDVLRSFDRTNRFLQQGDAASD